MNHFLKINNMFSMENFKLYFPLFLIVVRLKSILSSLDYGWI